MVFLSERKTSAVEKSPETLTLLNNDLKNDLEDLNILLDSKNEKENKAPFGIQGKGHDITVRALMSPGPGAYNVDSHRKMSFSSGVNPFLFKSPRFKSSKPENNDIPGPGAYNIVNKSVMPKNIIQIRPSSDVSFKYNTNSLNNIATIPAKKQKYGYYLNRAIEEYQRLRYIISSGHKENVIENAKMIGNIINDLFTNISAIGDGNQKYDMNNIAKEINDEFIEKQNEKEKTQQKV